MTHLFIGNKNDDSPTRTLLQHLDETKNFRDYKASDIRKLINGLKVADTDIERLRNQVSSATKDLAQMRRLNHELSLMINSIKEACKQDKESSDRLKSIVAAFKLDTLNTLFTFSLDGEDINVT